MPPGPTPELDSDRRSRLVLDLLGDSSRYAILGLLSDGEKNVAELTEALVATQPRVSHHLTLMRAARVVEGRHRGRFVYYSPSKLGKAALKAIGVLRAAVEKEG